MKINPIPGRGFILSWSAKSSWKAQKERGKDNPWGLNEREKIVILIGALAVAFWGFDYLYYSPEEKHHEPEGRDPGRGL